MKKIFFMTLVLTLLVSCKNTVEQPQTNYNTLEQVKEITLSDVTTLHLYRSNDSDNYICVCLTDEDNHVDEFVGLGNADYCTSEVGGITLDTVSFSPDVPSYILRSYDKTSTFGAETWFVLSPYDDNNPNGFWSLYRLPFQMLGCSDVDGDGLAEIVSYSDPQHSDSTVYGFHKGVLAVK